MTEVTVAELANDPRLGLSLQRLAGEAGLGRPIRHPRVQKSGLALAGHFYGVVPTRVQVLGETELSYLDTLASEPAYARIFLVESHAAGPEALRRRVQIQERFTDALAGLFEAKEPHERLACELLVNAGASMATTRLALGEDASLPEMKAPIVDLVRRLV